MLKQYFTGIVVSVLVCTALFIPAKCEEDDTSIDSENIEVESKYKDLDVDDNGVEVVNLQCRLKDLGYYNYKVTGYYGDLTVHAVKLFQQYNDIEVTGKVDGATSNILYDNIAARMPMSAIDSTADRYGNTPSPTPKATATPKTNSSSGTTSKATGNNTVSVRGSGNVATGSYMDWSEVTGIFTKGTVATVIDFDTGISWTVKRTGGSKHADVEPVDSANTALYKQALGKYFKNWTRHACIVVVKGYRIAASYHGYPHGYDSISNNNLTGHYCIHFKNSRTHCSNKIDGDHQACVKKAAGL